MLNRLKKRIPNMQLNRPLLIILGFLASSCAPSVRESSLGLISSPTPSSATSNTCDGFLNNQIQTTLFYEKPTVSIGEICKSALSTRRCQSGVWSAWTGTSFRAVSCTTSSSQYTAHTVSDFAKYVATCGMVNSINQCALAQEAILEEI